MDKELAKRNAERIENVIKVLIKHGFIEECYGSILDPDESSDLSDVIKDLHKALYKALE